MVRTDLFAIATIFNASRQQSFSPQVKGYAHFRWSRSALDQLKSFSPIGTAVNVARLTLWNVMAFLVGSSTSIVRHHLCLVSLAMGWKRVHF